MKIYKNKSFFSNGSGGGGGPGFEGRIRLNFENERERRFWLHQGTNQDLLKGFNHLKYSIKLALYSNIYIHVKFLLFMNGFI